MRGLSTVDVEQDGNEDFVAGVSSFPRVTYAPLRELARVTAHGTRLHPVWYRHAQSFCTPST